MRLATLVAARQTIQNVKTALTKFLDGREASIKEAADMVSKIQSNNVLNDRLTWARKMEKKVRSASSEATSCEYDTSASTEAKRSSVGLNSQASFFATLFILTRLITQHQSSCDELRILLIRCWHLQRSHTWIYRLVKWGDKKNVNKFSLVENQIAKMCCKIYFKIKRTTQTSLSL